MSNMPKILVVRASGGLANRLLALTSGIALALVTKRCLCIDWRDGLYSDDFSNIFPTWFSLEHVPYMPVEDVLLYMEKGASVYPPFWQEHFAKTVAVEYLFDGNNHMSPENMHISSIDQENMHTDADIAFFWHYNEKLCIKLAPLLLPYLKERFAEAVNLQAEDVPAFIFRTCIVPKAELSEAADTFFAKHFSSSPVGIHIRHTDLKSPLPLMLEKLCAVAKRDEALFLCTDSVEVEDMVCKLFPHTITQKKIFLDSGIPLHSYVPGISNVQKGREALLDMLILAKCRTIIRYAPSSFARIAVILAHMPKESVHVVPKQKTQ